MIIMVAQVICELFLRKFCIATLTLYLHNAHIACLCMIAVCQRRHYYNYYNHYLLLVCLLVWRPARAHSGMPYLRWCQETWASNEGPLDGSWSKRRPLQGPSPGWKRLLLRHYAKWALTHTHEIGSPTLHNVFQQCCYCCSKLPVIGQLDLMRASSANHRQLTA